MNRVSTVVILYWFRYIDVVRNIYTKLFQQQLVVFS